MPPEPIKQQLKSMAWVAIGSILYGMLILAFGAMCGLFVGLALDKGLGMTVNYWATVVTGIFVSLVMYDDGGQSQ